LLIDNADELGKWLEKDGRTDQELAYWIPKYILMRGDKPFEDMGTMTPRMKALAQSQDKIGFRNFMEGCMSIHFYEIQNFHLAMCSSFINGADWVSKILHITHSQWIFRNFSLHDNGHGYLLKKKADEIALELEYLAGIAPEDVPVGGPQKLNFFQSRVTKTIKTPKFHVTCSFYSRESKSLLPPPPSQWCSTLPPRFSLFARKIPCRAWESIKRLT